MKRIPFLFAFLLPPQVQDISWTWEKQGKDLKTVQARSLSSMSLVPVFHRFHVWSSKDQIKFPDTASGEWFLLETLTGRTRSTGKRWSVDELVDDDLPAQEQKLLSVAGLRFRVSRAGRRIELLDPQSPSANAWVMDVPTEASSVTWASDGRDYLYALSRETREFFVLNPRSMRSMRRVRWDPSVEIVDLISCPGREQVLIEQPSQRPLTRVVRLRDWSPTGYTVFDLSQGKTRSDFSKALTLNCREIFFAGPYGLQRVQY